MEKSTAPAVVASHPIEEQAKTRLISSTNEANLVVAGCPDSKNEVPHNHTFPPSSMMMCATSAHSVRQVQGWSSKTRMQWARKVWQELALLGNGPEVAAAAHRFPDAQHVSGLGLRPNRLSGQRQQSLWQA